MARIDELGREVLDQTPTAIPIPFTRPEPIHVRLRRLVERYHQDMKDAEEYETFEDADDFDVHDGALSYEDAPSEYEANFMPRKIPPIDTVEKEISPAGSAQGSPAQSTSPEPSQPAATATPQPVAGGSSGV